MTDSLILVDKKDGVARVTLNRPDAMNALSRELMIALAQTFRALQQDPSVAAVILTGSGRAFCAGLDLKQLGEQGLDAFALSGENDIQAAVLEFDRPIIGAINGVAATGGFEVALWCDVLIASTKARFIDTHARVGLVSGWGLSQRLQRIIGVNRARELHFTGNALDAERAERWGLVNRVVEPEQLLSSCEALAADMASCDRTTLVRLKRVVNEGGAMPLSAALHYENMAMDLHGAAQSGGDIEARREQLQSRNRSS